MELKQKRFVYEKAFSVEGAIQNLKTYQIARGEADPSVLCKRLSGSGDSGVKSSVAERKKRRRRKYKERRRVKRRREREELGEAEEREDESPSHSVKTSSTANERGEVSGSLGLLATQYSSSDDDRSCDQSHDQDSTSQELAVPDAILGMYVYECEGEGVTGETGEGGEGGTSVLGYFESPAPSSGERGAEKKDTHSNLNNFSSQVQERVRERWDEVKAKWRFPPSELQTFVCASCGKVGHLTQDCTVSSAEKEPLKIPTSLKALYSKAHRLSGKKDIHCTDCGITSNLVCCLDCRSVHCDGRGHLSAHLLSHPTHTSLFSCKLKKVIKCSNSLCQTVSVYDLFICSRCLGNAFSHHYSMITACWTSAGLRKVQNAISCEDHFHWHRVNCPSSAEERFVNRDRLQQQATVSEFFF